MSTVENQEAGPREPGRCTGPTSEIGKYNSSRNALKHGLTAGRNGKAVVTAEEFSAGRTADFIKDLQPSNAIALAATTRAALASVQVEHAGKEFNAMLQEHKERAANAWDIDRKAEAADLISQIHKKPTQTVTKLLKSRQGVESLIHLWTGIRGVVAKNGDLDKQDRRYILDLMGYDTVFRKGDYPFDPPADVTDRKAFILKMIDQNIDNLTELAESDLAQLDLEKRSRAMGGMHLNLDKDLARMMRYQRDAEKRFYRAMDDVHRENPQPGSEPKEAPAPPKNPKPKPSPAAQSSQSTPRSFRELESMPRADSNTIDVRLTSLETLFPQMDTPAELFKMRDYVQFLLQLEESVWNEAEWALIKQCCPIMR